MTNKDPVPIIPGVIPGVYLAWCGDDHAYDGRHRACPNCGSENRIFIANVLEKVAKLADATRLQLAPVPANVRELTPEEDEAIKQAEMIWGRPPAGHGYDITKRKDGTLEAIPGWGAADKP